MAFAYQIWADGRLLGYGLDKVNAARKARMFIDNNRLVEVKDVIRGEILWRCEDKIISILKNGEMVQMTKGKKKGLD